MYSLLIQIQIQIQYTSGNARVGYDIIYNFVKSILQINCPDFVYSTSPGAVYLEKMDRREHRFFLGRFAL